MSATSYQFAVAAHIMTVLGYEYPGEVTSSILAASVNTEPTFVRRSISKLAKTGLVITSRGKGGACRLSRPPDQITLSQIYVAAESPAAFAVHTYPVQERCPISPNIKGALSAIQCQTQRAVEETLSRTTLADVVADMRQKVRKNARIPRAK
jgi:Rrf2 family protein